MMMMMLLLLMMMMMLMMMMTRMMTVFWQIPSQQRPAGQSEARLEQRALLRCVVEGAGQLHLASLRRLLGHDP
jgi:hypothetical protein